MPTPGPEGAPHPTLRVLAIGDVRLFVSARFFSGIAHSLLSAALAWHLFAVTESYFQLGLLGLVQFLPVIPSSLLAGVLADRFRRRNIVILTQLVSCGGACLLALDLAGSAEVIVIYAAAFGIAISTAFERPAGAAMLPALVPREIFQSATVLNSAMRQVAFIVGPIAMGFATARFDVHASYAITAALFVLATLILAFVFPHAPEASVVRFSFDALLREVREGIGFVRDQPAVLGAMALDMFAVIFAGATALLPIYAKEILMVGPSGYGLLASAMGIGTSLMTIVLLVARPLLRPGRALMIAIAFFGLATIVFGLSRSFPLSIAALVIAGMADQISMTTRSVIIQLSTPDALRGRVSSVNMIFIGASNELGAAESGFLAALTSATFSAVAGGMACLGVLGFVATRNRTLRKFEPPA